MRLIQFVSNIELDEILNRKQLSDAFKWVYDADSHFSSSWHFSKHWSKFSTVKLEISFADIFNLSINLNCFKLDVDCKLSKIWVDVDVDVVVDVDRNDST